MKYNKPLLSAVFFLLNPVLNLDFLIVQMVWSIWLVVCLTPPSGLKHLGTVEIRINLIDFCIGCTEENLTFLSYSKIPYGLINQSKIR